MIELAQTLMCIAYILFFLSVIPNMFEVWKNQGKLKGFNLIGTTLVGTGLFIVQISLWFDSAFVPVLIGIPNMIYWIFLNFMLWKQHLDSR